MNPGQAVVTVTFSMYCADKTSKEKNSLELNIGMVEISSITPEFSGEFNRQIRVFKAHFATDIGSCSQWQKVCFFPNFKEKIPNSRNQKNYHHFVTS